MAFDEKDVTEQVQVDEVQAVQEISFRRNANLEGVKLTISVVKNVCIDGQIHQVSGDVPSSIVDAAWPGNVRTLKQHLFSIIDNVVF